VASFPRPFDLVLHEVGKGLDDDASQAYLRFHARRYGHLLAAVGDVIGTRPATEIRVLDVGPAYQTALLRGMWVGLAVDTLGFGDVRFAPRAGERHFHVDLNETAAAEVVEGGHDLIVLAEVIEHLYTSGETVLAFLRRFVPAGGTLLLQTPNAVALPRRLKMLIGRNPSEPIRPDRFDPGHFHEYTVDELATAAVAAGFRVGGTELANYFANGGGLRRRYNELVAPRLPSSLRDGITMVLSAT
jgi:hypothetical protein